MRFERRVHKFCRDCPLSRSRLARPGGCAPNSHPPAPGLYSMLVQSQATPRQAEPSRLTCSPTHGSSSTRGVRRPATPRDREKVVWEAAFCRSNVPSRTFYVRLVVDTLLSDTVIFIGPVTSPILVTYAISSPQGARIRSTPDIPHSDHLICILGCHELEWPTWDKQGLDRQPEACRVGLSRHR
jgi:hypothetical protein